ncbi:MAG: P-loop NTPase [Leifsonia sp.]
MAAVALLLDRHTEDAFLPEIIENGHVVAARPSTARELVDLLDAVELDAVITAAAHGSLSRDLLEACDAHGIRVIAIAATELERRHAAELGLHEVLDADARWDDVQQLLVNRVPAPTIPAVREGGATGAGIIAVWGPAGSPGRTTVAVNVAAELAMTGANVLLVDADSYGGSVAPMLGMLDEAPGFAAACRLAGADSLTADELDRIAQRYGASVGGFRVLTGISRASRWPELAAGRVTSALARCRAWADIVVVDTGFSLETDEEISSDLFAPRRNAATISALRSADHIVAVGAADPIGLPRFLRGYADLIETIEPPRVSVVLNRVRSSAAGIGGAAQARATLRRFGGIERAAVVPDDQRGVDAAVLVGRTLPDASRRSPARLAIARFVEEELLPQREGADRVRRLRRGRSPVRYAGERVDAQ